MAGLVGVLRQLGDVAEFAAEIFNDLHEEVLATASRGHGLMVRVQQLEAEVPSIEKAFLAQTDHSSFFNNAGVDWHPKQRMDQNLVTQDGLPRFVMDSYEECRGPPRLFLLDKFDVAGAGSCLKRYTDPSFFKVETSAMTNADGHREKKNRKAKKRGPRWRNKETSEVQPMSHAKFYQHLLEEPIENGVNKPARRAKLKKRLHFSPFDSKSGGSYMAELLKYPSPEHEMFGEISMSSPLRLSTNDLHESGLEFLEPREDSLVGDCAEIKRSLSPDGNMHIETVEKDIPVDGESNTEGYVTGYQSDEVASEIDNFVDAPSTIESGMDTDSEMRVKNDFASPSTNNQQSGSVDNEEHIHSLTSDSHSTGDLTISDDANSSSKKEMSSFLSSESPETSADNRHSRKMSAEGISSADIPEIAAVDASSYQKTATSDDEEKKINLIMDHPRSSRVSDSNSQSGNDSRSSTAGEHVVEEPNCENGSRTSTVCHSKDSSAEMSDNMLHQDDYDHKDLNNLNNCSVFQNRDDNAEMIPTENSVSGGLDDDVLKMTEKGLSNYTDNVHSGDDITSKLTRDEKLKDKLDKRDSDVFSDVSNHSSCIMEASLGKEPVETSFAEAIDAQELCSNSSIENQVISKTLISSPKEDSPDLVEAGLDTHDGVSIPENDTTVNQTPELGNTESCEVVGVGGTGITYVEEPNDFVAPESSSCTPENLENHAGMSGFAAYDEVGPDKDAIGREVTETSSYEDRKSPNEAHEPLDESVSKTDRTETGAMASSLAVTVSDIDVGENVSLHVGLDNLVKEHISCFDDSGLNENEKILSECHQESGLVEEDNSYLSESHTKSGLVDEVNVGEGSTSEDLRTVSCSTVDKDLPKLNVLHTVPDSYIDSAVEATKVWSPLEQCGNLDADEESFQKSGIENQISDATSLPINCETEVAMLEKTELPPAQVDQESTFLLPINHQQILNHDENHHENPASSPELQELRNNGIDISKYPKDDPSGFMFLPSNNPFSETNNQIDLDELPPLPPLPPVQWRMGKNHNASSITTTMKEEVTKQNDFFPQESNISFSLEHTKPEEEKIETIDIPLKIENEQQQQIVMPTPENEVTSPAADIETIDFPLKIENEQQQQIVMPTPENEVTSPAAEIETIDFPLKIENEHQQQIVMSTPENEVTSPAAEIERIDLPLKIGNEQQQQTVMPTPENEVTSPEAEIETIDFPLKIENEQQQQIVMPTPDNEVTSPAAEIETIDFPLKIENEQQQQIVMPTPENEVTPPAAEVNGIVNEIRTVKLPRPPNPLIESIDVLDKSKLRKASERVRPQLQKVEERDSLLEQIRAKSFNLKPAVSSKPSITGPQTNLNIAAILERANAIRQAFAGSDEDDEDNWSDS